MKAVLVTTLDGPSAVEIVETDPPRRSRDEVLIDVKAAGVAFPEVLQSRGLYQLKPDLPFIPGAEVSGVVAEAPASSGLKPGDRVAALCVLGGFAQQVAVPADRVFALPDEVSFVEGASIIFNYGTAYFALLERGRLAPGESVLVHGAAGGIGTAAIQMSKAFGASRVLAVTSTEEKGKVALSVGADDFVLSRDFKDHVRAEGGVDIVVDPVGGDERFTDSLRCLKPGGRLLVVGFTAGEIPSVRVNRLLLNNLDVVGVGWGAYALQRPGHVALEWAALLPHLRSGALKPLIDKVYPLGAASKALDDIEQRRIMGKAVLLVDGNDR